MRDYSLAHLSDPVLLRDLADLVCRDRIHTSVLLAHLAEVDTRKLYAPAGYPSMYAYCIGALRMSEESASRRIQAARAARRFPVLFTEIAEGTLHMTAVCLLAPHLAPDNVEELVAAARHRSKSEIEMILARRGTPKLQAHDRVWAITGIDAGCVTQHSLANVVRANPAQTEIEPPQSAPPDVEIAERYVVRITIDRGTHERLRYAQALLSHAVPSGDMGQVFDRALVALIGQLERRKFGAGGRPSGRTTARSRRIPGAIKRAVWERDGGRCTFVGADGHRCGSQKFLEIDHVEPYARTSEASVDGLRLRCRAHNQYEAERVFGSEFMKRKREQARTAREQRRRDHAEDRRRDALEDGAKTVAADAALEEQIQDVLSALRGLGIKGEHARRAADCARAVPNATLVDRIRAALQYHGDWISRSPKLERALRASSG